MKSILIILSLVLCSCIGGQRVAFHESGAIKSITQLDAVLAEGEASAREIVSPEGWRVSSVQQKYDGTRVAGDAIDTYGVLGLAKIAQPATVKGTKDPNFIPKDPNKIPKDPNVIPLDPNKVVELPP